MDSYDTGIPDSVADMVLLIDTIQSISDTNALFHEIHRLLKPDGFLFMDPGHMKVAKARGTVEDADLFTMVEFDGRNMLLARSKTPRGGEAA